MVLRAPQRSVRGKLGEHVVSIPHGPFVNLGGVDGLIHITDLSWGRIKHPEEVVSLDEKINVVILDFDEDRKRIHDHREVYPGRPRRAADKDEEKAQMLRFR